MKHIHTLRWHLLRIFVCVILSSSTIYPWNPFSADDWNDLGGEIVDTFSEAGKWLGNQAVAVADIFVQAAQWVGEQGKKAYAEAKTASEVVYKEALAPTGKFLEQAGQTTIAAVKDGANIVVDRFKDTQVTRAIDYYTRLGALQAAYHVASGVLTAAQQTATQTLKATQLAAEKTMEGAQLFLKEVATPLASGVLKGSAEAAKGILEGAKQTSVGILEGGKWVVNKTLGQVDLTRIHYDGNLRDFASGILGNVAVDAKVIQDISFRATLNIHNILASFQPVVDEIVKALKAAFVDPFTPQIATMNTSKKEVDELLKQLEGMNPPSAALYNLEGLSKAQASWDILQEELNNAQKMAKEGEATVISAQDFAKLAPQEKIAQANKLDPDVKKQMIEANLALLKTTKVCPGCYFENITIEGLDLSTAVLQGAVMVNVTLRTVNLSSATMSGIAIVSSTIDGCNFNNANLDGALIAALKPENQTVINGCNFVQANLAGARINAQLNNCNLDEINGVGLELKLAAIGQGTTLRKANLQWMEADMVVFAPYTQLTEADLRNAILIEVDLSQAILTQAHLENATLVFTRLSVVKADGISLQGTNFLFGVSLRGANLAKAAVSPETNWQGANLCGALMPDGSVNQSDCKKPLSLHTWQVDDTGVVQDNKNKLVMHKKCVGCMLQGVDLRGMNLAGVDLSKSWLVRADLRGTNLSNANLRGARLQGAKVDAQTRFDGAQFCRALMPNSSWSNDACGLPEKPQTVEPTVQEPSRAPTKGAPSAQALNNLATLQTTKACPKCDLRNIEFVEKNAAKFNLEGALLADANLTGTNLSQAVIKGANLQNATLVEVDFTRAQAQNAVFKGADMKFVQMVGMQAQEANFFKADLTNADMHTGNFTSANFSGAVLMNVDIEGADFTGANLLGAQWSPRTYNDKSTADNAIFCRTVMPDGTVNNRDCNKNK